MTSPHHHAERRMVHDTTGNYRIGFRICIPLIMFLFIVCATWVGCGRGEGNAPLEVLGVVKARHSTGIQQSPWGIQAGILDESLVAKAADIGVKWTRLQATWSEIERDSGVYRWEKTDQAFSAALAKGITPFVTIGGTNEFYVKTRTDLDPRLAEVYGTRPLPPTSNPAAMKAWLRFVGNVIERYKDRITYWEIWNEPNHFAYWGDEPNGKEYGRLVNQTATLIKKEDPHAVILAGALAGLDSAFTDAFLGAGNQNLVDIVTFHHYAIIPEERIYPADKVWAAIKKHNPRIALWQGECGTASHSSTSGFRGMSPWGVMIQAKWLLRQSFTDTYFCRAGMSNYFLLMDRRTRGEVQKRDFLSPRDSILGYPERGGYRVRAVGVNEKCLLENPGLKPKPAYYAYQNLCAVMDGAYVPVEAGHEISIRDVGVFYGIGPEEDAFPSVPLVATYKTGAGKGLLAYWLPWHPQEIIRTATVDLKVKSLSFKDPVLVDPLSGEVFKLTDITRTADDIVLHNIPLGDYPFIVVERDAVEIVNRQ